MHIDEEAVEDDEADFEKAAPLVTDDLDNDSDTPIDFEANIEEDCCCCCCCCCWNSDPEENLVDSNCAAKLDACTALIDEIDWEEDADFEWTTSIAILVDVDSFDEEDECDDVEPIDSTATDLEADFNGSNCTVTLYDEVSITFGFGFEDTKTCLFEELSENDWATAAVLVDSDWMASFEVVSTAANLDAEETDDLKDSDWADSLTDFWDDSLATNPEICVLAAFKDSNCEEASDADDEEDL